MQQYINKEALLQQMTRVTPWDQAQYPGITYPPLVTAQASQAPVNIPEVKKVNVIPKKPSFLKSLAIIIAAAWLAHKIWKNRDKIEARAEKLLGKLIGKLGLGD